MPYLAVAAASYYGQATGGHDVIKFRRHDPRIEALQIRVIAPAATPLLARGAGKDPEISPATAPAP